MPVFPSHNSRPEFLPSAEFPNAKPDFSLNGLLPEHLNTPKPITKRPSTRQPNTPIPPNQPTTGTSCGPRACSLTCTSSEFCSQTGAICVGAPCCPAYQCRNRRPVLFGPPSPNPREEEPQLPPVPSPPTRPSSPCGDPECGLTCGSGLRCVRTGAVCFGKPCCTANTCQKDF